MIARWETKLAIKSLGKILFLIHSNFIKNKDFDNNYNKNNSNKTDKARNQKFEIENTLQIDNLEDLK